MRPEEMLARCGGTASAAELLAVVSRHHLRSAVERQRVLRVGRGRYALPGLDAEPALRLGGVLGGTSAALVHGWEVLTPPRQPVVLLPRAARRPVGVEPRWGLPPAAHVADHVTVPARTAVDCARWLPFVDALCIVDSALRHGVRPTELHAMLGEVPHPWRAHARAVVNAADPGSASILETLVRAHSRGVGLELESQVQIGDARVDLADRRLRIVVECDSFAFHGGPQAFTRDVRRYTELVRRGWTVVRFAWADVAHGPETVRSVLRDVVATREEGRPRCVGCPV